MPIIQVNGIKLAYDVQGDPRGEPILLIAGLGLQLISWSEKFCEHLIEQGFRVIRFDNRDSGLSSIMDRLDTSPPAFGLFKSMFHMPLLSAYTLYDMAEDAVGLLTALDIRKAHIVGASMGGMIAQIIAARSPHRTLSLTSIMSTSGRPGLPGPTLAAQNAIFSTPKNPHDFDSVVEHLVHLFQCIGSPKYPTPEPLLRANIMASVRRSVCPGGMARQLMAIAASGDRGALLGTIRTPTLVIHGTDDPLVPVAGGRDTARLVQGAMLEEIDGMGHDIPPALEAKLAAMIGSHCQGASAFDGARRA